MNQLEEARPVVTVGIAVYNDERYLAAAIEDILAQSYPNLEIIISDNCSTDGSSHICREYADQDIRIRYVRQKRNLGAHANFEYLLNNARGTYFMWAASDDRWDSEFVTQLARSLEEAPAAAVAFCRYVEIDEKGDIISGNFDFNFSGSSAVSRVCKFHLAYSPRRDTFFYGLFRRDRIAEARLGKWWWINRPIAMNVAFPPLSYVLAAGDYRFAGCDRPLFFKRVHKNSKARHSTHFVGRPIAAFFAFQLRNINKLYDTEKSVIRGSGSVLTGIAVFPVLAARCLVDALIQVLRALIASLRWVAKVVGL